MKNKKKTLKRYIVSFDMRWAHDVYVSAPNKWAARSKAFIRFIKKLTHKDFRIDVELDERYQ